MPLISTDGIRGQLFGSQALQGPWLLIWQEVERQFRQATSTANTAIFDATNAQRRHRREVIALARELGFTQIMGIWVDTPVWLCLARNKRRSRQVPEEIILRMHRQLRDAPKSGRGARRADPLIRKIGVRKLRSHVEQEPHLIFYILC